MNGVLTKGGKKYFVTLIDDSTRFCYVYLLNTKDKALYTLLQNLEGPLVHILEVVVPPVMQNISGANV
jgi:hypothetical protein